MAPPPQRSNNLAFAAHQENSSTKVVGKRPLSVIVVGSGIAGLAAARALRHASFEVTVLESRNRIGGRICTDYSFGFPVDLGASWLHGVSPKNPLGALIGRLGLPLYRTSGDNSVLYDHDLESCCLFEKDGSKVSGGLVTKVGEIFGEYLEETKKLRLEYGGDMSMRKAFSLVSERRPDLRLEGLEAKVFQWYICRMEGWFSSDADDISLQGWDEEELLEGGHGLMVKGYSPLVLALAASLDVRFNHRVTKVVRRFHRVQVFTEDGKVLNADAAVITVPLGVLKAKTINFVPRLPEWKEAAIADLGIGNENKIAMLFKTACWPNVDFLGVVAPSSYECSYFLNLHKATGHPVLVYMPAGRLADSLEKKSDKDAANFAIIELKKILPHVSEPVKCLVSHWGTDRNSLGSYSFDSVGKPHDLYERMRVPVDNLFFAGEATSIKFPGTVHGAFSTGLMAAEECRNKFMEHYGDLELFQPVMAEEELSGPATPIQISRL